MKLAPAIRRRVTPQRSGTPPTPEGAPVQVQTQEPPREETAVEIDDALLFPEFETVHAFDAETPSYHQTDGRSLGQEKAERVYIKKYILCPTDVEGIIRAFGWKACAYEGRRWFVSIRTKEGNLVANVRQYAVLWATQDAGVPGDHRVPERLETLHHDGSTTETLHPRAS